MGWTTIIPDNLQSLHSTEEQLCDKAAEIVTVDKNLQLHLIVVERAMDLADMLRQFETDDEDLKVAQVFGMRTFNAFAASLKLALSGYGPWRRSAPKPHTGTADGVFVR